MSSNKGIPTIFTRIGSSGKDLNHMFCEQCSVTMCIEVTAGKFYSISVPTLDNDADIKPSMAIYAASAPSWAVFPEGVPKFDILSPNFGS